METGTSQNFNQWRKLKRYLRKSKQLATSYPSLSPTTLSTMTWPHHSLRSLSVFSLSSSFLSQAFKPSGICIHLFLSYNNGGRTSPPLHLSKASSSTCSWGFIPSCSSHRCCPSKASSPLPGTQTLFHSNRSFSH